MLRDDTQALGTLWRPRRGGGDITLATLIAKAGSVCMAHYLQMTDPDSKEERLQGRIGNKMNRTQDGATEVIPREHPGNH